VATEQRAQRAAIVSQHLPSATLCCVVWHCQWHLRTKGFKIKAVLTPHRRVKFQESDDSDSCNTSSKQDPLCHCRPVLAFSTGVKSHRTAAH
jgi:hypothetical protein